MYSNAERDPKGEAREERTLGRYLGRNSGRGESIEIHLRRDVYLYFTRISQGHILIGPIRRGPPGRRTGIIGLVGGIMIDTAASRLEGSVTLVIEAFARAQSGRGL